MNDQNYNNGQNGPDDFNRFKSTVAKRSMSTASLICAVIAILSFQIFFISLPLAGASIILALLSRGKESMSARAKAALIAGIAGFIMSSAYTAYAVVTVYNNPQLRSQVEQLYQYYTGQITGNGETEETEPSENPQQILQDILSGKYREEQENGLASGGNSSDESVSGQTVSRSGGSYI